MKEYQRFVLVGAAAGAILGALGGLLYFRQKGPSSTALEPLNPRRAGRLALATLAVIRQIAELV